VACCGGTEFDYSREDSDLDEEEPLRASRNERELDSAPWGSLFDTIVNPRVGQ
jgi:hypothetical protein